MQVPTGKDSNIKPNAHWPEVAGPGLGFGVWQTGTVLLSYCLMRIEV